MSDTEQDPFGINARLAATTGDGIDVSAVRLVDPTRWQAAGGVDVVLLDRVADVDRDATAYCVHGQTTCLRCRQWCWLGDRTHHLVSTGQCAPLCRPCAAEVVPGTHRPVANAADHLRADGAH